MKSVNKRKNKDIRKQAEFQEYVQFIALPSIAKQNIYGCITDLEFAKKYNLNKSTLSEWKKIDGFFDLVKNAVLERLKCRLPEVLDGIIASAREGNPQNAKLFLQYVMGWDKKSEESEGSLSELSDDELQEKRKEVESIVCERGLPSMLISAEEAAEFEMKVEEIVAKERKKKVN